MVIATVNRLVLVAATFGLVSSVAVANSTIDSIQHKESSQSSQDLTFKPMAFTKNLGQWPDSILFRANANGATMWFTKNGIWYQFSRTVERSSAATAATEPAADAIHASSGRLIRDSIETTMIKAEFVGASEAVEVVGLNEQDYKCNYFMGNDHSKWRTNVPNYSALTMRGLYPGVDITFVVRNGNLQEEVKASSNGALARVKVDYQGAVDSTFQRDNVTTIQTSLGEHHFKSALLADAFESRSASKISSATSAASGVTLVYSTFLGGKDGDYGYSVAVNTEGNAYVTGSTYSVNFPTQNPYQAYIDSGSSDAFVAKLNTVGSGLVYSSYFGGSNSDYGRGIAVDAEGNACVAGSTNSANFPTQAPFQALKGGDNDAFVLKITNDGSALIYSTFLGGIRDDGGGGIAIDAEGNAYVTGVVTSENFPTKNPFQDSLGSTFDAFVTKLNNAGSGLIYSTYLGGDGDDWANGIGVDSAGKVCVMGLTESTNFPTQNSFQDSLGGGYRDVFVARLNSSGNGLVYGTYLGGSGAEYGFGIAVDVVGNAYVTGYTLSANFPTQNPLQASLSGTSDAFVTKLSSAGGGLIYSTYLGGNLGDQGSGIAVDVAGHAYVTGGTGSENYPILSPFQASNGGTADAFVTKLNKAGNGLVYSTYLGTYGYDYGFGIAVDTGGNAFLSGETYSSDFPTRDPFQALFGGGSTNRPYDAFVVKFGSYSCCSGPSGNVDCDAMDQVDVGDLTTLIDNLFINFTPLCCDDEANCDGSGGVDVGDLTRLIDNLFINFTPLAGCQ